MILFKKDDLVRFLQYGKKATTRSRDWNQAKVGSRHQLRINFNYPPFAYADIESIELIDLDTDLTEELLYDLGHLGDYESYMSEDYNDVSEKKLVRFSNIEFNKDFPWDEFLKE